MLKLVDDSVTYEKKYKLSDEQEDKWPVFILRRLSSNKKNEIDDQITETGKDGRIQFKGGTSRRMKIDAALVDWRNVFDKDGQPQPCSPENKGKMPSEVQEWLENEIDGTNKLKGLNKEEIKK